MDLPETPDVDVFIVGAGLSGIGAACHLIDEAPQKTFRIVEARSSIGGTWDLFRYPGIRSDSDMFTLGYSFKPWKEPKAIADGPSIMKYLHETVDEYQLGASITFNHKVTSASWSTSTQLWTVSLLDQISGMTETTTCRFLYVNTGYYRYDQGHQPSFLGAETFSGPILHPQFWPEDFEPEGKNIVVIGSGATAVTLVPSLAALGAQVTLLQRSPTYIFCGSETDALADKVRRWLPSKLAYGVIRAKNIALNSFSWWVCRRHPEIAKSMFRKNIQRQLPAGFDIDTHFTPSYNPWDQRVCLDPSARLFRAITKGSVTVVTNTIERFSPEGVVLASGESLTCDVIVTATGLELQVLGGIDLDVDGVTIDPGATVTYRGMMFDGVPNLAYTTGYTNASWTLKADLVARYLTRLFRELDRRHATSVTPVLDDPSMSTSVSFGLDAGYVRRAVGQIPLEGSSKPWRLDQKYPRDYLDLHFGKLDQSVVFN
jgi:hypothetical protein